jgi:hypothetical protein
MGMSTNRRLARWHHDRGGGLGLVPNNGVHGIERQVEPIDPAPRLEQTAVTEVKAQQVRVRVLGELLEWVLPVARAAYACCGSVRRSSIREPGKPTAPPIHDRAPWNSSQSRNLAAVNSLRRQRQYAADLGWGPSHSISGSGAAGGIRTHTPFRARPFESRESASSSTAARIPILTTVPRESRPVVRSLCQTCAELLTEREPRYLR